MQLLTTLATLAAAAAVGNCQLQKVNDFNAGPTKVGMYAYVPKTLTKPAPIIVAVHHCQGTAQAFSSESQLMPQADKHGIILIFPNSKSSGGCFDVASDASMWTSSPLPVWFP
jgi:poly(3-hydroxybutyrate) depolymerase